MKNFLSNSIVSRVRLAVFTTAIVAVVVTGGFVITSEYFLFRENYTNTVASVADVLAFNVTAPLVFDDDRDAKLILQSLDQVDGISAGVVLDADHKIFASYPSQPPTALLNLIAQSEASGTEVILGEGGLVRISTIEFDGEIIGYLAVSASLDGIYTRLKFQLLILGLIVAVALAIAFIFGSRMQRVITGPIEQLSKAMEEVTSSSNYEVRMPDQNLREIGILSKGFNNMLAQIHERDTRLATANDELEETVYARTSELENTNSELTRTLSEVEEAREKAEAASRAKGAFLATMSHEIRTPINGFLGNTELLLNEELPPKARKYGEIAYRSGEALLDIINDILDFSRIEAGKLELNERSFSFGQVVEELCVSLKPVIRQKQLELIVQSAGAPEKLVIGDQGRVRQVVSNLIANAMKFTDSGSITVRVTHRVLAEDSVSVRVSVQDTGIGIAPGQLSTVFERFEQVDNSFERVVGGTGLGLAICQELVRAMGGDIGVDSEVDAGSVFWFEIPLELTSQKAMGFTSPTARKIKLREDEAPCRALVVDDSEINRDMAFNMLVSLGAIVEVACDGRQAIELVQQTPFDLILMDCQMPEIDGFRATRRIRSIEEERRMQPAYIVALTANAIKGDRERCLQAGMSDYLAKPFKMEELQRQVAAALDYRNVQSLLQVESSEATLDQSVLANIRSLEDSGAKGLLSRYIDIYLRTVPDLIKAIGDGITSKDSDALTFAAHSLKSESAPLGAVQLSALAKQLEEKGRNICFEGTAELFQSVQEEFRIVEQALLHELEMTA